MLAALFKLVHEDERAPKTRLSDAVRVIHKAFARHQFTGVYVLRGEVLELAAFEGPPSEHTRIPIGKGLCGKAVTQKHDLDIGDVNAQPEYLACSLTTKSEAIALVWFKGEIVGQIDVDSDTAGEFGSEAMADLATAAHIIAPLVLQVR
jgi:L-methionine (R)-S-oxide reductase